MFKSGRSIFTKDKGLAQRIDNVVERLVREFNPEKIILFGSYARGEHTQYSTIDIMVIARTKLRFLARIKKAILATHGDHPPVEPLVYTPEEFDLLQSQGEGFLEEALEEGIVLYEKNRKASSAGKGKKR